jgi:hypothetical protein
MPTANGQDRVVVRFFVDEACDPTLFNARGRIIVGTEGCSAYFRSVAAIGDAIGKPTCRGPASRTDPHPRTIAPMERALRAMMMPLRGICRAILIPGVSPPAIHILPLRGNAADRSTNRHCDANRSASPHGDVNPSANRCRCVNRRKDRHGVA